jgi:hypothetical protein
MKLMLFFTAAPNGSAPQTATAATSMAFTKLRRQLRRPPFFGRWPQCRAERYKHCHKAQEPLAQPSVAKAEPRSFYIIVLPNSVLTQGGGQLSQFQRIEALSSAS